MQPLIKCVSGPAVVLFYLMPSHHHFDSDSKLYSQSGICPDETCIPSPPRLYVSTADRSSCFPTLAFFARVFECLHSSHTRMKTHCFIALNRLNILLQVDLINMSVMFRHLFQAQLAVRALFFRRLSVSPSFSLSLSIHPRNNCLSPHCLLTPLTLSVCLSPTQYHFPR